MLLCILLCLWSYCISSLAPTTILELFSAIIGAVVSKCAFCLILTNMVFKRKMHKCGEGKEDPGIYSLRTGANPKPVRRMDPLSQTRPVPGFPSVFQIPVPAGTHFWFPLANRIWSRRPSGCPFSNSLLTFLFLVFTLNLLNLLAKWKCTCLAKKKLTITAYFPYPSAFLPLIVISYSFRGYKQGTSRGRKPSISSTGPLHLNSSCSGVVYR